MSFLIDSYHNIVSLFWSHVVTHLSRCVTCKFIHVFKSRVHRAILPPDCGLDLLVAIAPLGRKKGK